MTRPNVVSWPSTIASSSNINNVRMNCNNNNHSSIEEIDAQLAANTASVDDILDEETHLDNNGDVDATATADMEGVPPLSHAGAVPEVLAEAQAFTPQDEQRELDSLTLQERMAIQSDLLGITTGVSNLAVRASSAATGNVSDMGGIAAGILEHASFGDPDDHVPSTRKSNQDGWATTLHRLEQEIAALPTRQTESYRRAQRECPDEVSDRRKMAFVEYDNGSVKEAAVRLCKYWEERLSAFGPDRAFLPMTLAGAMRDEVLPMIQYPIWRRLPVTDAAGRAILYGETSLRDFTKYSPEQEVRAMMYMFETMLEDDDLRRKGFVCLYNSQNLQQHQCSRALVRQHVNLFETVLPIRISAVHICHPSKFMFYIFLPVVKFFLPKEVRLRIKIHYGDEEKILRELDGFCLPRDRVPDSLGGNLHYNMNQWVLDRMAVENRRLMLQIQPAGFGTATGNMRQISVASDITGDSTGDSSTNSAKGSASKKRRGPASKKAARSRSKKFKKLASAKASSVSSSLDSKNGKKPEGKKRQTKPSKKQQEDLVRGPPRGKYVDPRMQKAVEAKMGDPTLPLYDALVIGGFVFKEDPSIKDGMVDLDGTTLAQRKNNLCRRIRIEREKITKKSA